MKYLIRFIFFLFLIAMIACSNSGEGSLVKRRLAIDYRDSHIWGGSDEGAQERKLDTLKLIPKADEVKTNTDIGEHDTIFLDVDSLYSAQIRNYFSTVSEQIKSKYEYLTFEFIGDNGNMLTYQGPDETGNNVKIVSSYIFKKDSLFVLKGGDTEVFVACKIDGRDEYYRTFSAALYKPEKEDENAQTTKESSEENPELVANEIKTFDKVIDNIDSVLKMIGVNSSKEFTNEKDSIMWCNIKYTFK